MEHKLKTLSKYFQDIRSGRKNFEVRYNDRNFQVGDVLILEEISDECQYTEQVERRTINYILNNSLYCKEGYVILGLKFDKQESQGWIKCSDRLPEECIEKELCIDCLDYIKSVMTKETKQSISNHHCDHAGECAGCEIKQAKKFRNIIIDHEPCWACKHESACKYSHVPECTPCEFEFDESKF